MGFFDDYPGFQATSMTGAMLGRLNPRHDAIVAANRDLFVGARVLDLASHDGRWSFAAIKAGAAHVLGVEARPDLIANAEEAFRVYGVEHDRYSFVRADAIEYLRTARPQVDLVLILGFLYHVWQQIELIRLVAETGARHVVVDTAILADSRLHPSAPVVVELRLETIDGEGNQALPDREGSAEAFVGHPSRQAVTTMFDYFGFDAVEFDWPALIREYPVEAISDYVQGNRTTFLMTRRT